MRLRNSKPPVAASRAFIATGIALALLAGAGCRAPTASSAARKRLDQWRENAALVAVRGVIWNETITAAEPIRISLLVRNISKVEVYALKQFNSRNYSFQSKTSVRAVHGDGDYAHADEHFVWLKPRETMVFPFTFWHEERPGEAEFRVSFHNNMPGEQQAVPQRDSIPVVNHLEYDFGKVTIHPSSEERGRQSRPEETEKERKSGRLSPGDVIQLRFGCQKSEQPPQLRIDDRGQVRPPFGLETNIGGLTAAEAASRIRAAYVPRYYREIDVGVMKVQQNRSTE